MEKNFVKIKWLYFLPFFCLTAVASPSASSAQVVDFEDLTLSSESFYNGADGAGGFTSQGAFFNNNYNPTFQSWSGWSYSNTTDTTTPGFLNQYSAYTGGGFNGSSNYGVAFTFAPGSAYIDLPTGFSAKSAQITNTTYAALSILNGDQFAKKFGGASGNDPDFFLLKITGLDAANQQTGSVDFYLADYRFTDNSQDYLVDTWNLVDLSSLGGATKLSFAVTSSDIGPFGLNTPAYFALDNLTLEPSNVATVPEPFVVPSLLGFAAFGIGSLKRKLKQS
ncbi:hypothetical protein Cylst_5225 [Cylindrospermum stagnale PCC 7417]|uniref:PEP-CTERM exosortase interaction domain-containing protein n=1 Tax=Cylindrospermum stagnale PCC 7417 TaxID=56107 RepID=K9X579_9NOST|nr:hypothetical protein Cylst_5225 [Cylindrospermum stagnale PCC 7417]